MTKVKLVIVCIFEVLAAVGVKCNELSATFVSQSVTKNGAGPVS